MPDAKPPNTRQLLFGLRRSWCELVTYELLFKTLASCTGKQVCPWYPLTL